MLRWLEHRRALRERSDEINEHARHPIYRGGANRHLELRIGYLIDLLRSRPEAREADKEAIAWRHSTKEIGKVTFVAASHLGMVGSRPWDSLDGPHPEYDYWSTYGVMYHYLVTGYLSEEELARGEAVYRRLLDVDPTSISALVNLAELERRRGHLEQAATWAKDGRKAAADQTWCANLFDPFVATIDPTETGGMKEALRLAERGDVRAIITFFREYENHRSAGVDAHSAIVRASSSGQRVALRAAMELGGMGHASPAIGGFEECDAGHQLAEDVSRGGRLGETCRPTRR